MSEPGAYFRRLKEDSKSRDGSEEEEQDYGIEVSIEYGAEGLLRRSRSGGQVAVGAEGGLYEVLKQVTGFVFPNEIGLHWNLLIVIYPYLTGLVAGAFIIASLANVFNIEGVRPVRRLSLLTALSFLIVAPLPLMVHLSRPERGIEIFLTPNTSSAMAMFSFVYLWFLLAVLCLEIWFDFRHDLIKKARHERGVRHLIDRFLALYTRDVSPKALSLDEKAVYVLSIVGIPSALVLTGYAGFIFGSMKANPWWSSVLMPIVFLMSAIVSGIALMLLIYMVTSFLRGKKPDIDCLDKLANFLFYMIIIDFALEGLEVIQRIYQSDESLAVLAQVVQVRLLNSLIGAQLVAGMIVPLVAIVLVKAFSAGPSVKTVVYFVVGLLVQVGIFAMRWNVVVGGQLFSKSFRGLTVARLEWLGLDGLLIGVAFLVTPLVILYVLTLFLPPFAVKEKGQASHLITSQGEPI